MKNFEYRVETFHGFSDPEMFQHQLNVFGKKGWELFWVLEPIKSEFVMIIFKREL